MASEATNSSPGVGASVGGPSPFSRPPQPKPVSMYDRAPVAAPSAARPRGANAAPLPASPASVGTGTIDEARKALESQRRNGAQWFYWVAALSLINCVVALTGAQWRFILGLGVTQVVQELSHRSGPSADVTAGLVSLAVIGLFAFFGYQATKGRGRARPISHARRLTHPPSTLTQAQCASSSLRASRLSRTLFRTRPPHGGPDRSS